MIVPTSLDEFEWMEEPGESEEFNWTLSALCSQTDPEAFFPEKGSSGTSARKICEQCPVRAECLREALKSQSTMPDGRLHGIWGGYGEKSRSDLRKKFTDNGKNPLAPVEEIQLYLDAFGAVKKPKGNKWNGRA